MSQISDISDLFSLIYALPIVFIKDVNEYLNRYLNIRMGIRIIFEYSMVNGIIFSHRNM